MNVGIVGAGLLGRLLAWRLVQKGHQVTVFDKHNQSGKGSAAYAAGGMLSLIAEQETSEPLIDTLARESVVRWREWLPQLKQPVFFQEKNSILLAHTKERLALDHLVHRIRQRVDSAKIHAIDFNTIQTLEPELDFQHGYCLADEAQIDARGLLAALASALIQSNVTWHVETEVNMLSPGLIAVENQTFEFDWVFDCRGVGAQTVFSDLRAVRGELMYLHAPEVHLSHVIRLHHPRYRLYIIPRPEQIYLIGATEIESADVSPISVRSCLELLSAAYSLHSGFAEARIVETISAMRPAFSDNLPRIFYQPGLIAINGLYRHGFLIAPAMIDKVCHLLDRGMEYKTDLNLVREASCDGYRI